MRGCGTGGNPPTAVVADGVVDRRQRGIRVRRSTSAPHTGQANIEVDAYVKDRDGDYHPTNPYSQLVGSETPYSGVTGTETKQVTEGPDALSGLACILTIVSLARTSAPPPSARSPGRWRCPGPPR